MNPKKKFSLKSIIVTIVCSCSLVGSPLYVYADTLSETLESDQYLEGGSSTAHVSGEWSPVIDLPVLMIHASLLPNGKVLTWDANADDFDGDPHTNDDKTTRAIVWDPATGSYFRVDPNTESDLFCSGHAHLPDGRLFVAGGDTGDNGAIDKTNIFSSISNTWTRVENMSYARWYPSVTPLANGEMLVTGGTPDTPEVWTTEGTWRTLPNINMGIDFPWLQTTPTGDVIYVGPGKNLRRISTSGDGHSTNAGQRDSISRTYGSYAMYDVGKLLVTGGGPSTTSTVLIDTATGDVTTTDALAYGRRQHNLTVLPDGTVLVTGGNSSGVKYIDMDNGVYAAELWNPVTGQWSTMATMQMTRQYHSTALLLPDARVMTGGGGRCDECEVLGYHAQSAEIFSPPYLFKDDGSGDLARRPVIDSAPQTVSHGHKFLVGTDDASSIDRVTLVRLSSVTHSVNMEQRLIPLTFAASSTFLNIDAPADANIAPPGYYMLFAIDEDGVPSIAKFVQVTTQTPSSTAPPIVANPGNRADSETDSVTFEVLATDPDNNGLAFSASGLPDGITIENATGLVSGTLSYQSEGTHNVTIIVNDGIESTQISFLWDVANVNRPPILGNPGAQQNSEQDEVILDVLVSDPDQEPLTFRAESLPEGLSIGAASGRISGTISYEAARAYSAVVGVTDGEDSDSITFNWSVADLNRSPVVTQLENLSNSEGDSVSIQVVGSDPDGDTVIFGATLPDGLSIDEDSGSITGELSYNSAGNHPTVISVSDGVENSTMSFDWAVSNVNRLPTFSPLEDRANSEGESVAFTIEATDLDSESLAFRADDLPDGVTIDAATGSISGTLSYASSGNHTVAVHASDGIDIVSTSFSWVIGNVNQPPSITDLSDQAHAEGDIVSEQIQATDLDGTSLHYSVNTLPNGLSIDPNLGLISGTLTYGSAGNYNITVTVGDGMDTTSTTFMWAVQNTNRPPLFEDLDNQVSDEGDIISLVVQANDLDGDEIAYSATGLPAPLTINPLTGEISGKLPFDVVGNYHVSIRGTDGIDNTTVEFVWSVGDVNRPPDLLLQGDLLHVEGESVSIPMKAADPDNTALTFHASNLPDGIKINPNIGLVSGDLSFESAGTYAIIVTVTDGKLSDSIEFTWIVEATNRPPELATFDTQAYVSGTSISLPVIATDPDGEALTYSATGLPPGLMIHATTGLISGTLENPGKYMSTVTVDDGASSETRTISWSIVETKGPTEKEPEKNHVYLPYLR